uniref:Secreted protein n=1 Tax=Spongospora subterranea TaxID=70186 RepID=A0A0H5RBC7_9EUKA|eukprot:CRZ11111.1 hypothetical protein [Spongospora subterranea]
MGGTYSALWALYAFKNLVDALSIDTFPGCPGQMSPRRSPHRDLLGEWRQEGTLMSSLCRSRNGNFAGLLRCSPVWIYCGPLSLLSRFLGLRRWPPSMFSCRLNGAALMSGELSRSLG